EIISAAKFSVFFLDEDQRVTLNDIGTVAEIEHWARAANASVTRLTLESQFRCNGSNGYLAWIDHTLQIRSTANPTLEGIDYDFRVCDSPGELRDRIFKANAGRNKSRMVAGYCWDWKSQKNKNAEDFTLREFGFSARWNLAADGSLWIVKPESVSEIGCIHTCQGLELEYVGVIIGPDLVVRNGVVQTEATKRSSQDSSIKGYRTRLKRDPAGAKIDADRIIRNTYRTLLTRGQRGCFVYAMDPETNAFLKRSIGGGALTVTIPLERFPGLHLRVMSPSEVKPFVNAVPLYDIQVAAGGFSVPQFPTECDWVELPDGVVARADLFVTRVVGESMNKRIANGSWCLFKRAQAGSRNGKVMLVELLDRQDPETAGRYTVKLYLSEKRSTDDESWEHTKITLKPQTTNSEYSEIVITSNPDESLRVIGELVAVL
ncbi:MAG TPA: DNA/RNA helicase domain-containing protein, partial [Terriglobales bacterium]|nr:DNA/RNA helicase domain-containing protein [Terriglobales bacterium]